MSRFVALLVLLLIHCASVASDLGRDHFGHRRHHGLPHHHRKHSKHPKHPHQMVNGRRIWSSDLLEAYQLYLSRAISLASSSVSSEELPWWFHFIPLPWPFPWPAPPPPPPRPAPACPPPPSPVSFTASDIDRINFALNIHYLQAEFFLHAAFGHGLDGVNATLARGGPSPIGGRKAKLSQRIEHVSKELGLQSTGHIRAIHSKLDNQSISRPLLNISSEVWNSFIDRAVCRNQSSGSNFTEFDPYENDVNFLLAAYVIPFVGLNTLVDANNRVSGTEAKKLVSGLMGVQAGQDAAIRTLLFDIMHEEVAPYNMTVSKLTSLISNLRLKLDHTRKADEGLTVHLSRGAEKRINGNLISANDFSMAISRSPRQVLQVLYGSGNASRPGLFFPQGGTGNIARNFLK